MRLKRYKLSFVFLFLLANYAALAQHTQTAAEQQYQNPVLHADYSDPDVIAVGHDYYMTASSFNAVPGLPVLHSTDLVHWSMITYALQQQLPADVFDRPQHGNGVWAPAIRFHNNEFFIFYPDPDYGIYMIKARQASGPWSNPILVEGGKGLIDPCPFWDTNGKVYLIHAFAGSRAGIKSILVIKELSKAADKVISDGVLVYDGHGIDPTIEGPKLYKRNGYYYIFAPAGGVSAGWQTVLRSESIYGPYERKVVMQQGSTAINGPHQGAWVHTAFGEDWFLHFQDKGAYGRVVHLQPLQWRHNWPVIGNDADGDGVGEPVSECRMPASAASSVALSMQEADDFNGNQLGLQWQWQANPKAGWAFSYPAKGVLRLNSILQSPEVKNLWMTPNLLLQKFPAENFLVTAKITFTGITTGEKAGLVVMGRSYAGIAVTKKEDGLYLIYEVCNKADTGALPDEKLLSKLSNPELYCKLQVSKGGVCVFSYSSDGINFTTAGSGFIAEPGKWVGAKFGIFCNRYLTTNDSGFAEFDWIKVDH